MTTTDTQIIAERKWERVLDDGTFLVADAKLVHLAGNARPCFSLTGEHWQSKRHHDRGWESGLSCGAIHDEIVEAWPELAPLAAIHLSDDEGVPMYAVENGWYWYTRDEHLSAKLLRVSLEDIVPQSRRTWTSSPSTSRRSASSGSVKRARRSR